MAQKVDAENQRLLKAIVAQKPHIEQAKTQVEEYQKYTLTFKQRRHKLAEQDPASKVMQKKRDFMKGVTSKLPILPSEYTMKVSTEVSPSESRMAMELNASSS